MPANGQFARFLLGGEPLHDGGRAGLVACLGFILAVAGQERQEGEAQSLNSCGSPLCDGRHCIEAPCVASPSDDLLMIEALNDRIRDLRTKLRSRNKVMTRHAMASGQLKVQLSRRLELVHKIEKEGADVAKLEGLSLAALFHSIFGDKYAKLEQERKELAEATLAHEECRAAVRELELEVKRMESELADFAGFDEEMLEALAEKERYLSLPGSEHAALLIGKSEAVGDAKSDVIEAEEAIEAAHDVVSALQDVEGHLDRARSLGHWDMFGGGMIATAMKHSSMDDAQRAIQRVQQKLRVFQGELADIGQSHSVDIEIEPFLKFADYFFDGFFVDLAVQSKINNALEATGDALIDMRELLRQLEREATQRRKRVNALQVERQRLIEEA